MCATGCWLSRGLVPRSAAVVSGKVIHNAYVNRILLLLRRRVTPLFLSVLISCRQVVVLFLGGGRALLEGVGVESFFALLELGRRPASLGGLRRAHCAITAL